MAINLKNYDLLGNLGIHEGDKFICINDCFFDNTKKAIFKKGQIYTSMHHGCITDYNGNDWHSFSRDFWVLYLMKMPTSTQPIEKQLKEFESIILSNDVPIGIKLEVLRDMKKQGYVYNFKLKTIQKIK